MITDNMKNKLRGIEYLTVKNTDKTRYRFDFKTNTLYVPISENNFTGMFSNCYCAKEIELCVDNKIEEATGMFNHCFKLTKINFVKKLDLEKVENLSLVFYDCSSIEKIDLSNIITSKKLDSILSMFYNCTSLKEVNFGDNFHSENIIYASGLFYNCQNLEIIICNEHQQFKSLVYAKSMFECCKKLKKIDLRGVDFNKIADSRRMFHNTNSDLEVLVNRTYVKKY